MKILSAVFLLTWMGFASAASELSIAYVGIKKDTSYHPDRLYARHLGEPTGRAIDGVKAALKESKFVLSTLETRIQLQEIIERDQAQITAKISELAHQGTHYFLLDLPAPMAGAISRQFRGQPLLFLNVGSSDDRLRGEMCSPNLLHTLPSDSMSNDALAQYLIAKKWRDVLLLTGPTEADKIIATSFLRSAKRFGLKVREKPYLLSNDPRQRDKGNVPLLTSGDYDVIYVADHDGEFARHLPYRSQLPRPVVGNEGLRATAWHWSWERHGAPQLNARFEKTYQRRKGARDWAAWIAVKAIVESMLRTQASDFATVTSYLRGDEIVVDGFKGNRLSFRDWDGQLRQPLLIHTHNAVIERAPLQGYLHPSNNLDTLGTDASEKRCKP